MKALVPEAVLAVILALVSCCVCLAGGVVLTPSATRRSPTETPSETLSCSASRSSSRSASGSHSGRSLTRSPTDTATSVSRTLASASISRSWTRTQSTASGTSSVASLSGTRSDATSSITAIDSTSRSTTSSESSTSSRTLTMSMTRPSLSPTGSAESSVSFSEYSVSASLTRLSGTHSASRQHSHSDSFSITPSLTSSPSPSAMPSQTLTRSSTPPPTPTPTLLETFSESSTMSDTTMTPPPTPSATRSTSRRSATVSQSANRTETVTLILSWTVTRSRTPPNASDSLSETFSITQNRTQTAATASSTSTTTRSLTGSITSSRNTSVSVSSTRTASGNTSDTRSDSSTRQMTNSTTASESASRNTTVTTSFTTTRNLSLTTSPTLTLNETGTITVSTSRLSATKTPSQSPPRSNTSSLLVSATATVVISESPSATFNQTLTTSSTVSLTASGTGRSRSPSSTRTASATASRNLTLTDSLSASYDPCNRTFRSSADDFMGSITVISEVPAIMRQELVADANRTQFLTLNRVAFASLRAVRVLFTFNTDLRNFYLNTSKQWLPDPVVTNCIVGDVAPVSHRELALTLSYDATLSLFLRVQEDYACNVTFTSDIFQCQLLTNLTFNFSASMMVLGTPQAFPSLMQIISSLATSFIALLSGGGASLLSQSRSSSLSKFAQCQFSLVEPLDVDESPTQIGFGNGLQFYNRGAVAGNLGLLVFFFLLLLVPLSVCAVVRRRQVRVYAYAAADDAALEAERRVKLVVRSAARSGGDQTVATACTLNPEADPLPLIELGGLDAALESNASLIEMIPLPPPKSGLELGDGDTAGEVVGSTKPQRRRRRDVVREEEPVVVRRETFIESFVRHCGTVAFPSVMLLPMFVLVDATVTASVRLLRYPVDVYDSILAAFGLGVYGALLLGSLVLTTVFVRRRQMPSEIAKQLARKQQAVAGEAACNAAALDSSEPLEHVPALAPLQTVGNRRPSAVRLSKSVLLSSRSAARWLRWWMLPEFTFEPTRRRDRRWHAMVAFLFDESRYAYFICGDVALSMLMAVLVGMAVSSPDVCFRYAVVCWVFYAIYLVVLLVLRPNLTRFSLLLNVTTSVLGVISAGCIVVAMHNGSQQLMEVSQWINLVVLYLASMQMIATVFGVFLWIRHQRVKRRRRRATPIVRGCDPSDRVFFAVEEKVVESGSSSSSGEEGGGSHQVTLASVAVVLEGEVHDGLLSDGTLDVVLGSGEASGGESSSESDLEVDLDADGPPPCGDEPSQTRKRRVKKTEVTVDLEQPSGGIADQERSVEPDAPSVTAAKPDGRHHANEQQETGSVAVDPDRPSAPAFVKLTKAEMDVLLRTNRGRDAIKAAAGDGAKLMELLSEQLKELMELHGGLNAAELAAQFTWAAGDDAAQDDMLGLYYDEVHDEWRVKVDQDDIGAMWSSAMASERVAGVSEAPTGVQDDDWYATMLLAPSSHAEPPLDKNITGLCGQLITDIVASALAVVQSTCGVYLSIDDLISEAHDALSSTVVPSESDIRPDETCEGERNVQDVHHHQAQSRSLRVTWVDEKDSSSQASTSDSSADDTEPEAATGETKLIEL